MQLWLKTTDTDVGLDGEGRTIRILPASVQRSDAGFAYESHKSHPGGRASVCLGVLLSIRAQVLPNPLPYIRPEVFMQEVQLVF